MNWEVGASKSQKNKKHNITFWPSNIHLEPEKLGGRGKDTAPLG